MASSRDRSSPSRPHDELTGHMPQSADDTRSPSPAAFDFPTLNDDGSLPDLTAPTTHKHPPPSATALSSLGASPKMDNRDNVSESEGSLVDSQYDMLDDLSEISTDDHDTASITSNGDDGQLTVSEPDVDESTVILDDEETSTRPSTAQTLVDHPDALRTPEQLRRRQTRAENDLIDSYMSDDLDTPRQSTITSYRRLIANLPDCQAGKAHDDSINRILFISKQRRSHDIMDLICTRIASCMNSSGTHDSSVHRVVRLPTTPSGISPASATVVCGEDSVSATVQHCVGAEIISANSFKLQILDSDEKHTSIFTVSQDAKIDFVKPDIVVFFVTLTDASSDWLDSAVAATTVLKTPVLVIRDSSVNLGSPTPAVRSLVRKFPNPQAVITHEEFVDMRRPEVTDFIRNLLDESLTSSHSMKSNCSSSKSASTSDWRAMVFGLILLVLPCLFMGVFTMNNDFALSDPATVLAAREHSLIAALSTTLGSTNFTTDLDIQHLLPVPDESCSANDWFGRRYLSYTDCKANSRFQILSPSHMVISLPALPHFPKVTGFGVGKEDGRAVAFNQTKLIEGVYMFTFDADEAYGIVTAHLLTSMPQLNVTATHDYGHRMLQRKTYQKASVNVGKAVGKDVATMREVAKNLTGKLSTELNAGVWATKNITTQLALYVARDLQVLGNTAVSLLDKATRSRNKTSRTLNKDFVLVQRDVTRFTKAFSTMAMSTIEQAKRNSKAMIRSPLAMSRMRLQKFKNALERKKGAKASSFETEVSVASDTPKNNGLTERGSLHENQMDTEKA